VHATTADPFDPNVSTRYRSKRSFRPSNFLGGKTDNIGMDEDGRSNHGGLRHRESRLLQDATMKITLQRGAT
jgi:hypothetical protein